jgi:transketolase
MKLNRARILSRGTDITLFTSGICTEDAMRAVQALQSQGVSIEHLHISTLKPFSDPAIIEAAAKARYGVITLENHSIVGGLGTAVAERMAEAGLHQPLRRLGLNDRYLHGASKRYLMAEYGIDAPALVSAIEALVGQRFDISPEALASAPLTIYFSDSQQEAL